MIPRLSVEINIVIKNQVMNTGSVRRYIYFGQAGFCLLFIPVIMDLVSIVKRTRVAENKK
jgi:hypothetical protein